MATLSAATAASLLVGLMAIAPKVSMGGGSAADHSRQPAARRPQAPTTAPRINRTTIPEDATAPRV